MIKMSREYGSRGAYRALAAIFRFIHYGSTWQRPGRGAYRALATIFRFIHFICHVSTDPAAPTGL